MRAALSSNRFQLSHQTCRLCWFVHCHADNVRWAVNESTRQPGKTRSARKMPRLLSFGRPLCASYHGELQKFTGSGFTWRLMKWKETDTPSPSPLSSVLHAVARRPRSLLQPNRCAFKRDMSARRSRDGRLPALVSSAPGKRRSRLLPLLLQRHLARVRQVETRRGNAQMTKNGEDDRNGNPSEWLKRQHRVARPAEASRLWQLTFTSSLFLRSSPRAAAGSVNTAGRRFTCVCSDAMGRTTASLGDVLLLYDMQSLPHRMCLVIYKIIDFAYISSKWYQCHSSDLILSLLKPYTNET